jgi:hypothetical protein
MRQITAFGACIGTCLALLAGVVGANAQGIGYPPGVNPSNPQDMTHRSNPQDLLAPGGYNRQDLVRQPPAVNGPLRSRSEVTTVPTLRSDSSALQYTVKAKPKKKKKRHHRESTAHQ